MQLSRWFYASAYLELKGSIKILLFSFLPSNEKKAFR